MVRRPAWRYRDELYPGRWWVEKGARMTGAQVGATLPTYYTAGSSPGFLGMSVGGESGYNATPARGSFVFATVVGPLSSCAIQEAIQPHTTRLRTCYLRARTETPTLAGKLLVRFVIRSDGRVRAVELTEDTLHDAAVAQCAIPIDGQEP